ncbi:MAG: hypothetical protein LBR08_06780 [Bacteroidales bacterium]|nr:hypothetical protein [Bacteroidales bacterium]
MKKLNVILPMGLAVALLSASCGSSYHSYKKKRRGAPCNCPTFGDRQPSTNSYRVPVGGGET